LANRRSRLRKLSAQHGGEIDTAKWRLAREHLEEDGPEAVEVTSLVCVHLPRELFRTEIGRGSDGYRCGAGPAACSSQIERLHDPEPCHPNPSSGEQYVLGPEIPVAYSPAVGMRQGSGKVFRNGYGIAEGKRALTDQPFAE
jgi:hypothetical protein